MANYTLLDYSLNTYFNIGSDIMPLESISDGIDLTQSMCNTLKVTYPFKIYNSASYVGTSEGYSGTVFMSVFIFDSEPTIEANYSGTLEHIGNYYIYVTGVSTTAPTYTDYVTSPLELFLVQDTFKTYIGTHIVTGGGAGSGYIGNSLVSNKKMVGYNVPTSSAESTKTESANEASATPVSGKPKIGNGFARIKYLSDGIIRFKNAIVFPHDDYEVKGKNTENTYTIGQLKQTFSGNNTWFLIWDTNGYLALQFNASSSWNMKLASGKYIVEGDEREDWLWGMNNAADPLYPCYLSGSYIGQSWSLESKTIGNDTYRNDCYTGGTEEHPCIIVSTITGLAVYKDGVKVMVR